MFHFVHSIVCSVLVLILLTSTGCAIHYFDAESGIEHLWGVGHMAMKPSTSNEGLQAVGRRTDTVGVSTGKLQEGVHLALGWGGRQRIEIFDENTQLCLDWPRGSFYNARVGSEFPPQLDACTNTSREKTQ